jgi:hypothetical protein
LNNQTHDDNNNTYELISTHIGQTHAIVSLMAVASAILPGLVHGNGGSPFIDSQHPFPACIRVCVYVCVLRYFFPYCFISVIFLFASPFHRITIYSQHNIQAHERHAHSGNDFSCCFFFRSNRSPLQHTGRDERSLISTSETIRYSNRSGTIVVAMTRVEQGGEHGQSHVSTFVCNKQIRFNFLWLPHACIRPGTTTILLLILILLHIYSTCA